MRDGIKGWGNHKFTIYFWEGLGAIRECEMLLFTQVEIESAWIEACCCSQAVGSGVLWIKAGFGVGGVRLQWVYWVLGKHHCSNSSYLFKSG